MVELVDTTDLKSVGLYARAGSIPAIRTIYYKENHKTLLLDLLFQ